MEDVVALVVAEEEAVPEVVVAGAVDAAVAEEDSKRIGVSKQNVVKHVARKTSKSRPRNESMAPGRVVAAMPA